ncbi:MAG: hypothetical protein K1X68_11275 [Saprospiraceae bacterium]|nr:hypothetical protein [Saprospiraceae bacterium]HMW39100.1 hypothetical protein [Saprospiraceae bacterium]HMX88846.1 hypothetical protein [Saprospiraceae bacterium]HMZ39290.1 hypothetical protein [Saprospiraceae bacterium]HNA64120.1 hypothetical protein [Saprospiraceae bacterium]
MNQAKEDLQVIREMMERSSTFLSLSGLSGVAAGTVALIAAGVTAFSMNWKIGEGERDLPIPLYSTYDGPSLIGIALVTLIVALALALYFTYAKAKRLNISLWNNSARYFLLHLMIPLVTGGILCLFLLYHHLFAMTPAATLLFYGLALVSASKFANQYIFTLGLSELALAFIGLFLPGYGLLLWAIGFGVLHIVYGILMHFKYR